MKKILFRTLIIFFCSLLVLQSCKKNPDNNKNTEQYSLSKAEVKAEYERAVSSGLSQKPGKYTETVNPVWNNIKGYTLSPKRIGAYLTLSFNFSNGAWLRMLVMKDSGKVHSLLIEAVPDLTAYEKPLGIDYTMLTGKFIFYDSKGQIKGIVAVKDGKRLDKNRPQRIAFGGPGDDDEDKKDDDGDGVNNADDKCPNTPSGQMVDANGCDLDIPLNEVEIEGDGGDDDDGDNGGWLGGGWPGFPPGGPPSGPGDVGGPTGPEVGPGGDPNGSVVESQTVEFFLPSARLCGVYPASQIGNGYTIGIGNLGFTITIKTKYTSSSGSIVTTSYGMALIGSSCFTVGGTGMNSALASTAVVNAYNTAMEEVTSLAAAGGIPLDNISLSAALRAAISANMAMLPGGSFSSGKCANMLETPASYGCP